MSYRTFADDRGQCWEIWDVRPEGIERRDLVRRQDDGPGWMGPERRAEAQRRERFEQRTCLVAPLAHGWLVFMSDEEKRRLAPIPANWESCPNQELRKLWEQAQVIAGRIEEK